MLVLKSRLKELQEYVARRKDPALTKWLGNYAMSQGNAELAARLFNEAGAAFELTRLLCSRGDLDSAARLVAETGDIPSAVHLSRRYQLAGRFKDTIGLLERVGKFDHATRAAIAAGMTTEVMTLALRANAAAQREAAAYFRERGDLGSAVQLLRKAGDFAGCFLLCFDVRSLLWRSLAVSR